MTTHIKIPDIAPIIRLVGNGMQSIFSFPFPIFASEDMSVYLDGAQQSSGYSVSNAGNTNGGEVTFDIPPANGQVITLERRMPFERVSDFIEGGNFAAQAINAELDFMVADLQQLEQDQGNMVKFAKTETPTSTTFPDKSIRAGKALGFDGNGNMIAVPLAGTMAQPSFTAIGTGAITRTTSDKLDEHKSVKDFGAIGDGIADDTTAFQKALSASKFVLVPEGNTASHQPYPSQTGKHYQVLATHLRLLPIYLSLCCKSAGVITSYAISSFSEELSASN